MIEIPTFTFESRWRSTLLWSPRDASASWGRALLNGYGGEIEITKERKSSKQWLLLRWMETTPRDVNNSARYMFFRKSECSLLHRIRVTMSVNLAAN
jgi:hypothetical protein